MGRMRVRDRMAADIPTASMADIAFLLITFFMLTTVFTAIHGIEYGIPKREPSSNIKPKESVYIHILFNGQIQVDFVPIGSMENLARYIKTKMAQTEGRKPVIIRTDPDAPYGRTVEVLDLLKQLEVKNISIPTESEIAAWKTYFRD
jgi:biopolymer transport protein ExbD